MTAYKKYDAYKDSGIDWLGEIPNHWEVRKNKFLFRIIKKLVGKSSNDYELLSLTLKGIIKRDMVNMQGKFPAEFDTYQEVKIGDFVFCLFDVEETPRTVGLSEYNGMITGAYTVMRNMPTSNAKFLYYFYLNLDNDKRMKSLYTGLRNTISKENFFNFPTFLPPLPEQEKIAAFLDKKTADIDTAITQKREMIELLKERKQILINKAVTRGLNPDAPLRDSGIDWIGEIPSHWEVRKLKYCAEINKKSLGEDTDKNLAIEYVDIGSVTYENGISYTEKYLFGKAPSRARRLAQAGNTIISTVRTYLKAIDYIKEENTSLIFSTGFAVLQPLDNIFDLYLTLSVKSNFFTNQVDLKSKGMSYPAINSTDLSNLLLLLPPLSEQEEIANFIETHSSKIDQAIAHQEKEIATLQEYKSTLIDSAVRGKICLV